jgi:hypothetical protein
MAEYEGTLVNNDQYKVRKLEQQVRAERDKLSALQTRYEALDEKYINETEALKAQIQSMKEVPKPKVRKVAKPARKVVKK